MPNTNKTENRNWIFWLIIFGIFALLVYTLRSVLLPFVTGIIIGYLLDPLATKFERLKIGRTAATFLVLFLVAVILIPAIIALVGMVDEQLSQFITAVPGYMASLSKKIEPAILSLQDHIPGFSREKIREYLEGNMSNGLKLLGGVLRKLITSGKVDGVLPKVYKKEIETQARAIDKIISSFIRGQLSVCILLGTFYAVGLTFVGLDLGMLVGFIAGVISFIPYVGSIVGFVTAMAIAFAQFESWIPIAQVAGVFFVGQFLEGNFLTPKLVGDSVGLHPVWVMFALLAGGVLLGFLGLMIAVPMAAIIGVLVRFAISKYKKSSLYRD